MYTFKALHDQSPQYNRELLTVYKPTSPTFLEQLLLGIGALAMLLHAYDKNALPSSL